MKDNLDMLANRIYLGTEDKYGCNTLLTRSGIKQLNKDVQGKYTIFFDPGKSSNIFNIDNIFLGNQYDYIILVFDLDSQSEQDIEYAKKYNKQLSVRDRMLIFDDIINAFERKYSDGKGSGINIMHPERDDYVGNKVILIPVFFCFESLFFYSKDLLSMLPEIQKSDYEEYNRVLVDYNFFECLLSYFNIYRFLPPQRFIKYVSDYILQKKFSEEVQNGAININTILGKNTDELFEVVKNAGKDSVIEDIINSISEVAVFNEPFSRLLQVSTDKDMDIFISSFCFDKYKYTLKDMIDNYGEMMNWNPYTEINYHELSWYKYFTNRLYKSSDTALHNSQVLDKLCTFFVENFSLHKKVFAYNKKLTSYTSAAFLLPDNSNKLFTTNNSSLDTLNNDFLNALSF